LYGRGPERAKLRARIDRLGLYERVRLMGAVSPIETEWAKGAVAAVSSDMESFGMTIVEAMHCGVPVVATDCPHGPGEIIEHDANGILVPLGSGVDGYAAALDRIMTDHGLRSRLGKAARVRAAAFAPAAVALRYEELFRELRGRRGGRPARGSLWSRLRAALPSVGAGVRQPSGTAGAAPEPVVRPLASARARTDGTVGVRLDAASLPPGPLDFLARLRNDPKKRNIRVPVPAADPAAGADGIRVTLDPAAQEAAEGRWDCYVVPRGATAKRARLISVLAEQSRAVGRPPAVVDGQVTAWLPYTTTDGFLALRVWRRPAHAEVTGIVIDDDRATVTARLLGEASGADGAGLPDTASVVAVSRQGEAYDLTLPVTRLPGQDAWFSFTVPYSRAMELRSAEHDLWDLRLDLDPGSTGAPVPLGRIGGDIVDRKKTDVVPAVHLPHPERGDTRAKPFFTVTNDLALSFRDLAPEHDVTPGTAERDVTPEEEAAG
ncbi:glycosyltransferase, partial [Streptomyces sp. CRN 30]|uniref:glycosyltransferase n=1 Tax=Streptomyces sp. CRN 30 TaxID=3075613 RepID=UPI002A7F8BC8